MNGPRTFPSVTDTIVAATSPPANLVMTTFELIVVGKHPLATSPTTILVSKRLFVDAAAATPKNTAEVMRNDVTWTIR